MPDNNTRTLTANFTADTSGFSPKINDLVQKLKSASQEFEQNKTKISALKTEMKTYQKELANLEKTQRSGTTLTEEQKRRMQELRDKIAGCATQLGTYNSAQRQLTADMNSLNRQLSEARDQFNGTGQAAATFGEVLKANIASEAILGAIRKIVDWLRKAAAYCYSTGSSFEAVMSKVAAVSGASADDLKRLTEKAKELGASTKFTATQTAEAMNYMAMAGWKTEEMLSGIDAVLGLAAASGGDLATTSDIVTDAITAFGLKAKDCAHFADVLAAASANANTNVALMGETFKYCAADAGSLGFSAEDTVTAIGLMASAGIKGSQAGTALRKLFTQMSGDLTLTSKEFGDITVKTANASGEMRPFIDIVKDLREEFSKLNDQDKTAAAKELVGQYAQTGFKTLMNASDEDFQKLTGAIQNCKGAAADMAETMEQNVRGAVTKMNSALEGVGIAVFDKFKGGLLDAVNIFTETLGDLKTDIDGGSLDKSIDNLADSFKNLATSAANFVKNNLSGFINGFANALNFVAKFRVEMGSALKAFIAFKAAQGIGNVIMGIGRAFYTLSANIQMAGSAMNGLKVAFASNPVGMIATGVSALTFGISELVGHTKNASDSIEDLNQKSQELAQNAAKYKQEVDDLSDIKKEYEELHDAIDPDVDRTTALTEIQERLKDQFPELAKQIDLVNGKYDEMNGKLQDVIDKTSKAYKVQAEANLNAKKKIERSEDTEISADKISDSEISGDIAKEITQRMKMTSSGFLGLKTKVGIAFDGDYEKRLDEMNDLYDRIMSIENGKYAEDSFTLALAEKISKVQELKEELEAAQTEYDKLNGKQTDTDTSGYGGAWRNKEEAEKARRRQAEKEAEEKAREEQIKANKELYDKEKQLADDRYSVGELSEAAYYDKLTQLRDAYLQAQTHDWYTATAKIKGYQDKNLKDQKNALSETELAYKKTLAAIDAEIERHKRAKSDKEYEQKLADIDDRINYGRLDEFEKYELEKERKKLQEEREEELFSRRTADAKAAATENYNTQKALLDASASTREYTTALGDYTGELKNLSGVLKGVSQTFTVNGSGGTSVKNIDESTKNVVNNVVLQAVNRSNDQIVNALIKALSSRL